RGVVVVTKIPGIPHERIVAFIRRKLTSYWDQNPTIINLISGGTGSVLRMWERESERHPDVTVYLNSPPSDDPQAWNEWTPDIVVEVVSRSSAKRDYNVKPIDYLAAGVKAYWIIDPLDFTATVLTRRGVIRTALLPTFELRLTEVFAALAT